jgi:hypothetical protein
VHCYCFRHILKLDDDGGPTALHKTKARTTQTQESDTWKWTEMYKGVRLMVYNELGYGLFELLFCAKQSARHRRPTLICVLPIIREWFKLFRIYFFSISCRKRQSDNNLSKYQNIGLPTSPSDTWKWTEMYKGVRLMVYNELGYGV